jgi:hypothetical protein
VHALPEGTQVRLRRYRNRRRALPRIGLGVLTGETPWSLREDARFPSPILTARDVSDVDAAFVADPFGVEESGSWHVFFEVMNRNSGKGEIARASSPDLVHWTYEGMHLVEPFHLSYPGIYHTDNGIWMVPESWESKQVRLYRADPFPGRWVLDRVLLDGVAGTDPTLFRNPDATWSMLLCAAEDAHNETLRRFDAPAIVGPWVEAAGSPLVTGSPEQARPGGHCFWFEGVQYRLGQDCSRRYGERLRSFPLTSPWNRGGEDVLLPAEGDWRARGGHHADIHQDPSGGLIAFVDGES